MLHDQQEQNSSTLQLESSIVGLDFIKKIYVLARQIFSKVYEFLNLSLLIN